MKYNLGIKSVAIALPKEYTTPEQLESSLKNYDATKRRFKDFCIDFLGTKIMYNAEKDVHVSDLMAEASRIAIKRAGINVSEIGAIVTTSCTADHFGGARARVMKQLGLDDISGADIRAGCSGFPTAVHHTIDYARNPNNLPEDKYVLYCCGDTLRRYLKPGDIVPNGLFSDGAAAIILGKCDAEYGIKATYSRTRPALMDDAGNDPEGYVKLNGKVLKEESISRFPKLIKSALTANDWKLEDILVAPHLMNGVINNIWRKELGISDQNFVDAVHLYSNTSAASQAIAIYELWKTGRLKKGAKFVGPALGVGWDEAYVSGIISEDLLPVKQNIKLLLIDDDKTVADSQKGLLLNYFSQYANQRFLNDLTIDVAYSAKEAQDIINKTRIDGIIADQRMPQDTGGNGTDILQKILFTNPEIKAVMVSGASEDNDKRIMTDLKNIVGYIQKPLLSDLTFDLSDPNPEKNKIRRLFNFFHKYNIFQT